MKTIELHAPIGHTVALFYEDSRDEQGHMKEAVFPTFVVESIVTEIEVPDGVAGRDMLYRRRFFNKEKQTLDVTVEKPLSWPMEDSVPLERFRICW